MALYLDTNVFYHAYCPTEDASIVDWLFSQVHPEFPVITSEWCLIEMFRALKKQVNLETISEKNAELAIDFFLSDVGEMVKKKNLLLAPVSHALLITSREFIFSSNLYAADALHAATALKYNASAFITFDADFKANLQSIPVFNPSSHTFKTSISKLLSI